MLYAAVLFMLAALASCVVAAVSYSETAVYAVVAFTFASYLCVQCDSLRQKRKQRKQVRKRLQQIANMHHTRSYDWM